MQIILPTEVEADTFYFHLGPFPQFREHTLHPSLIQSSREIEFESGCHYPRHHSISPHSVRHAINKEKSQHGIAVGTRQGTFLLVKGFPLAANPIEIRSTSETGKEPVRWRDQCNAWDDVGSHDGRHD